jgi:hypothetical protein
MYVVGGEFLVNTETKATNSTPRSHR